MADVARAFGDDVTNGSPRSSPAKAERPAWSDAKLESSTQKVTDMWTNKLGEWEIRAKGLEMLQEMVGEGACEAEGFVPIFVREMREQLLDQMTRSASSKPALVKVACATASRLAVALRSQLAKSGELLVLALLNNIRDGQNQGVVDDSQECMATLLANVHHPKMIAQLLEAALTDKSPICRTASMEHLCFVVQRWPANIVKKQLPAITECIRKTQTDAAPGARTASRQCFWHLHARWEAAANKLQATLGPSEVRQLNNTKKTMDEEAEDGAEDGCPEIPTAWAPEVSEPAERTVRKSLTTGAARLSVDAPRTSLSGGVARAEPSTLSPKKAKIARRASDVAAEGGASPVKRALSPVREKKAAGLSESEQAEASFVKALKKCGDTTAATRLEGFHELRKLCSTMEGGAVSKQFEPLAIALTEHCADGNEKVACACLEALGSFVAEYGSLFLESYLARLLPSVLLKTFAKDRGAKAAVQRTLGEMRAHLAPEAFFTAILKTFSHKNPNIQFGCLDITTGMLSGAQSEASAAHFRASGKPIKLFLEKVLPYVKHRKPDFRNAATRCLLELHGAAPEAFKARMRKRTAEEQRDVTAALGATIPGFSVGGAAAAPVSRRAAAKGSPEAAATVIQSVARGRRGRKLSMERRRKLSMGGAAETQRTEAEAGDEELQEKLRRYRERKSRRNKGDGDKAEPEEEASQPRGRKAAVPRQPRAGPSSARGAKERLTKGKPKERKTKAPKAKQEEAQTRHPLFAEKPAPEEPAESKRKQKPQKEVSPTCIACVWGEGAAHGWDRLHRWWRWGRSCSASLPTSRDPSTVRALPLPSNSLPNQHLNAHVAGQAMTRRICWQACES